MNSKGIGERTEGIVLAHLLKQGKVILMPFGNNQRYDMVVDQGERFIRGQCKTATFTNGCVRFWACSTNGFTGAKTGYKGQVDVFWVYCPATDKVYQVPVDLVGETQVNLRVAEPKSGVSLSTIRWARDYEI